LVSGWDWELDLAVCDSSDCEKPPEFSSSSVGCTLTTRWPPETDYRLVLPTADQPLLPIEFTRREIKTCHFSPRKVERRERCELRARMLGSLLRGEPEASSIRADEDVTIVWRDRASFDDELRASIADLRARLGGVATALRRNGVLDDSTALAPVRVHMRLHDLRADILMPVPEPIAIDGVTYERQ
jgi:hypothetical protein